jgi:hypothetical protein
LLITTIIEWDNFNQIIFDQVLDNKQKLAACTLELAPRPEVVAMQSLKDKEPYDEQNCIRSGVGTKTRGYCNARFKNIVQQKNSTEHWV